MKVHLKYPTMTCDLRNEFAELLSLKFNSKFYKKFEI